MRYWRDATPNARMLLSIIWEMADMAIADGDVNAEGAALVVLSVHTLAELAQFDPASIQTHLTNLEYAGYIRRHFEGTRFNGIMEVAPDGMMFNIAGHLVEKRTPRLPSRDELPGYAPTKCRKHREPGRDMHMITRIMEAMAALGLHHHACIINIDALANRLRLSTSTINIYLEDMRALGMVVVHKGCGYDTIIRLTSEGCLYAIDHKLIKEGA